MHWYVLKLILNAAVLLAVTEVVKRSDRAGALLGSLPFVTLLAMLWIYHEAPAAERIEKVSTHAWLVFWYVLPTLPMFAVFPWMARHWGFYPALFAGAVLTMVFFVILRAVAPRWGVHL